MSNALAASGGTHERSTDGAPALRWAQLASGATATLARYRVRVHMKNLKRAAKHLSLATAALAVALTLTAASAQAAPPASFYGISSQTALAAEEFKLMGEGGVGTLRAIMNWAAIDPTEADDYNWVEFDGVVRESATNGIEVLPFIFATPLWASKLDGAKCKGAKCSIYPVKKAAGLAAWNKFVGDAVARYGPEGEFWTLNPEVPMLPIRNWQIWNEMNSETFYAPKPSPKGYAKLLSSAADAIRSRDPAAQIILGGMPSLDGSRKAVPGPDYLADFYKVPGVEEDFDGVAVHPYGAGLPKVKDQVLRFSKEVKRAKDTASGLWITEVGAGSAERGNPLNVGKKGQAKLVTDVYKYFAKSISKLNIKNVTWFSWRDSKQKICAWCPTSGLFDKNLKAKPSWAAFQKAAASAAP